MRKKGFVKKFVSYICVAALVLGGVANIKLANVRAEEEAPAGSETAATIAINDLGTITVADTDTDTYRGWFWASEVTSPEYKYLQMTYTGTGDVLDEMRLQFVDGEDGFSDFYWFAESQSVKFVTVDGGLAPKPTEEAQTVVIDLEASGLDVSKGIKGFHIHAGLNLKGTINFSDVKLQTTPEITKSEDVTPVSTIAINDLSTITVADTDTDTYRGWFWASEVTSPEYKYLQMTYTGTGDVLDEMRLQFVDGEDGFSDFYWFAESQSVKFVTVDGGLVPKPTEEAQTVVIDLEASGLDVSKGIKGFHIHAGLNLKGTINFSDVKLQTTPEITEPSNEDPTEPQVTTDKAPVEPVDPSTGIQLDDPASGMNGTYHIDQAAADAQDGVKWKYLGWVTFKDLATKDFKYLKFTYTGDITNLRFEFEDFPDKNGNKAKTVPYWFDPNQDVHFVTVDGSAIPMVGDNTTITIDLEKSGIDIGKYNSGIHMHGNSTTEAAFDVTIKDAVLFGGTPTVKETTTAPEKQTTTAPVKTTTAVKAPAKTKVKSATKKNASKKVKLTLKKIAGAKGYKVQFSKTKKFKKVLATKIVKKVKVTVSNKKLKKQKKLYVRAKAYKLNGKKKVYSKKWSAVKKVKITK